MSSDNEQATPIDEPTVADNPTVDTELVDAERQDDDPESANAEAARWRKQFREAEQRRDQLTAQVEALQRQQVEAHISLTGVKPAALWAVTGLADLLDGDGTVSTDLVAAAVQTARDQLGITTVGKGNVVPGIGNHPSAPPKTDDWTSAFKPQRR